MRGSLAKRSGHSFIGDGWALHTGRRAPQTLHSHHMYQVSIGLERARAMKLVEQCRGLDVRVFVNNAGCAVKNEEQLAHPERMRAMMQLNVVTMTELCLRLGAQMVDRGGGCVLNIGSMTAYVGASSLIGYASSKRHVISYSKELHSAFAPHGVRVACLVPGLTETSFFSASGVPLDTSAARRLGMLTPDQVAAQGYALAFAGPVVEICGLKNRWLARLAPWLPSFVIDRARRQLHGQAPGDLVPATAATARRAARSSDSR